MYYDEKIQETIRKKFDDVEFFLGSKMPLLACVKNWLHFIFIKYSIWRAGT